MSAPRLFEDAEDLMSRFATPRLEIRARSMDPETSWEAARITPGALSLLKVNILAILRDCGPLTDDAIFAEYTRRGCPKRTAQRVRSARDELTVKTNPPLVRRDAELGASALAYASQRWGFVPVEARRPHEYVPAIHPDSEYTEWVCSVDGLWKCPIAEASQAVPE